MIACMSLTYAPAQLVLTLVQLPGSWLPSVTPADHARRSTNSAKRFRLKRRHKEQEPPFRNRQVASSSLALGSSFFLVNQ